MNLWARMTRAVATFWASTTANPAGWFLDWYHDLVNQSDSGVAVNGKTVLQYAPVWHLVSRIAGHVAQLPCNVHEWVSDRETRIARHPSQKLVKYRANAYMSADVFRETLQAHALLWGNGRAAIDRNNRNDPSELIILLPDRTVTLLINGEKWHVVTLEDGSKVRLHDEDVLHIIGLGFDGIQGYSLIEMAKNSIGLGLASEKHTNKHFKHNAMPGVVIEAPSGFFRDEKAAKEFLADFEKWHAGLDNTSKPALLREGMKAQTLSMSGRDAQWIEQRKFQRQEAALWLVCEQILGDDSSVSYNSLEQKNLAYLSNCLNRWLVRWELELREKLLTGQQKRQETHYFKFNRNALLAVSAKERFEIYKAAIEIKVMNPNEVREKEDMAPYEGGDKYENPNINPVQPSADQPAKSQDQQQSDLERTANLIAMVADRMPKPEIHVDSPVTVNLPEQPAPVVNIEPPAVSVIVPEQAPPVVNVAGPSPELGVARAMIHQLVASRLKEIVSVEAHRVTEAATKQKNFITWIEDFYGDSGFLPRLKAVWQQCGGLEEQVTAYAAESKAMLLEAAGVATSTEELASVVAEATGRWVERADVQAELILTRPSEGRTAA